MRSYGEEYKKDITLVIRKVRYTNEKKSPDNVKDHVSRQKIYKRLPAANNAQQI